MGEYVTARCVVRYLARACCLFALGSAMVEAAGPNDDYLAGVKSFQEGDVVGAMAPLREAANAGHPKAQALLAEILDRSEFDEDAIALYRSSAEQGNADGMFGLGAMLAAGEGVKQKETLEARRWLQKAAESGHQQAISVMAQAYLKGELGITEAEGESPEALQWVRQAAENDYLPAVDALVSAYAKGNRWGLAANKGLAEQYQAQANKVRNVDPAKTKKKVRRL